MFTGYVSYIDQTFSIFRFVYLGLISFEMLKDEYRTQVTRPYRRARMLANYPDIRCNLSGVPVVH